jgi:hypothetical protein
LGGHLEFDLVAGPWRKPGGTRGRQQRHGQGQLDIYIFIFVVFIVGFMLGCFCTYLFNRIFTNKTVHGDAKLSIDARKKTTAPLTKSLNLQDTIFIAPHGHVYHLSANCSYIKNKN